MKILVVLLLALAVATGSQALVHRGKSDSRLTKLFKEVEELVLSLFRANFETWDAARKLELVQELRNEYRAVKSNLSDRFTNLEQEMSTEAQQALDLIGEVFWGVVSKAEIVLYEVRRKVMPETKEFYKALESYTEPLLKSGEPYTEPLHNALFAWAQQLNAELNEKLPQRLESFRPQLSPYIEDFQAFRASLEPYADRAQEQFKQGVETVTKHMQPYLAPILETFQQHKQEFKKWVVAPVFLPDQ